MAVRTKFVVYLTLFTALLATTAAWLLFGSFNAMAAATGIPPATVSEVASNSVGMGYLAAALATGISSLAAGYAVANIGSAAIGAIMEKPEMLGRVLILVGLGEGIAIYGLIISILILNKLG